MLKKVWRFALITLWLAIIAVTSLWIWSVLDDLIAAPLVAIPAAVTFALAALLARPPHLLQSPRRWAWGWQLVPKERRRRYKVLGRIPWFTYGKSLLAEEFVRIFSSRISPLVIWFALGAGYVAAQAKFAFIGQAVVGLWHDPRAFMLGLVLMILVKAIVIGLCALAFLLCFSLRFIGLFVATWAVALTSFVSFAKEQFEVDLPPNLDAVLAYDPVVSTRVYSAGGEPICTFTLQDRVKVPINRIPAVALNAFIAAEDQNFYRHHGIDPMAIARAAFANVSSGTSRQGGSTLSQQVVKQVILRTSEKSLLRKIREMLLTVALERQAEKQFGVRAKAKILETYLNHIYLGHGSYGLQTASQTYFGKDVSQLTLAEAALLAGLPKAPSRDSPYQHFRRAKARQDYVLDRMITLGFISFEEKQRAKNEEIALIEREDALNKTAAPYFCEHARRELKRMFGNDAIYRKGMVVRSTVDMRMQRAAEAAVRLGLIDLERRLGWTGPDGERDRAWNGQCDGDPDSVADNIIESGRIAVLGATVRICVRGALFELDPDDAGRLRKWEKSARTALAPGDVVTVRIDPREIRTRVRAKRTVREQVRTIRYAVFAKRTGGPEHPEALQAAIVVVDPQTGFLKALVGGYDWYENQYNNATQARRQLGSSVKPYVYLAALMNGTTVDAKLVDSPRCYPSASGTWCPKNYLGPHTRQQYMGLVDLRTALAKSLNSISVQLAAQVGIDQVIRTMRLLGIRSEIVPVLPVAVGTPQITLWEHVYAYATIAAAGQAMPRHPEAELSGVFFREIVDESGVVLYKYAPVERPQAVPAADAYALIHLMKGVVEIGTGKRVRELGRPAAGKTGTTNSFYDVWFMGFTPDLVAGVWVGRKTPQVIAKEATGGSVALPIWLAFMKAAHPDLPSREFPVPDDVILTIGKSGEIVPYQQGRLPRSLMTEQTPSSAHSTAP